MRARENLEKQIFDGVGKYDIPRIAGISPFPEWYADGGEPEFMPWNLAATCYDPEDKGIHFYQDDYLFLRVWTNPDKYLGLLGQYKAVLTPNFSLYTDFPLAVQIYNHYRKHWLGAYWQSKGITVIPTITWSTRESYQFCFDGEPRHSIVSTTSIGTCRYEESRKLFLQGFEEMLARLMPETVLFYGILPTEAERMLEQGKIKTIFIKKQTKDYLRPERRM